MPFLKLQAFPLYHGIDKKLHPVRIHGIGIKYLKFCYLFSEIINTVRSMDWNRVTSMQTVQCKPRLLTKIGLSCA